MAEAVETDVKAFIDHQRFSGLQWLVLVLCILVMAFDAIDLTVMGLIAPALGEEWRIARTALTPALTSSIVGTCIGAMVGGPVADVIGRKRVLLAATMSFGLFTFACAFAPSIGWLVGLRFLGGLGIGSASPVANTMMSEFAPERYRALTSNILLVGFTLGATAAGLAGAWVIPHWGWRAMLLLGGGLPMVLGLAIFAMPESVQFMVTKAWPQQKIGRVLERLRPGSGVLAANFARAGASHAPVTAGISALFRGRYLVGTIVLWLVYFLGLVIYYVFTSWLPTVVHGAGFSVAQASSVMAMFPLGGAVGTLGLGLVMDRLGSVKVVGLTYLASGVLIWLIGSMLGNIGMLSLLVFIAGAALNGAQLSMPAVASGFYPTLGRATGVSWMVGVGRVGGIFGALAGGSLLGLGWAYPTIFGVLSVPAFAAAAALFLSIRIFIRPRAPLGESLTGAAGGRHT